MLLQLIFLFTLLLLLFLLSQKIPTYLYSLFFLFTKNKKVSLAVLIFLLLPGTIIHELSHFILATILKVPTGEVTIFPTVEKSGRVKTGKMMLGKTDPFRRSLIGLSPMLLGMVLIYLIGEMFFKSPLTIFEPQEVMLNTLGLYLLLIVSTTMFSSSKDLESLCIAGPLTFLIAISLYLSGIRIFLEESLIVKINYILSSLNYYLLLAIVLDCLILLFFALNLYFWKRILSSHL